MDSLNKILATNTLVAIYMKEKYKSDKGHTHAYIVPYGEQMKDYQHKPIVFCEVGVAGGGSIHLWDSYFTHPDTIIYGVDIRFQHGLEPWEEIKSTLSSRVKLIEINSNLLAQTELNNLSFDIVLDDGSHLINDQVNFIKFFLPRMKNDGLLIVEDILPDDWNNPEVEHKTDALQNRNVSTLLKEVGGAALVFDHRDVPRFPEWGGGNWSQGSITMIYKQNLEVNK